MKKSLFTLSILAISMASMAQSGTNSPYSQYGFGILSDQSQGFNRGMNGVGIGFRESNQANYLNPASYSAVDSLTFIFDAGMSLQTTNFKENGKSKNASNADFEYAVGTFRALRHLGVGFGILPYSNVGYNYSNKKEITDYNIAPATNSITKITNTFTGSGGLHQVFIGLGWEPFKGISVGGNVSYLWGTIENYVTNSYSDNSVKALAKQYTTTISNVKFDLGAQYTFDYKGKTFTAGVTYTPGHNLKNDADCRVITSNSQSVVNDTTTLKAVNATSIPTQIGIGLSFKDNRHWKAGMDYKFEKWSSVVFPAYRESNGNTVYSSVSDMFKNRHSFKLGGEYCENENGRSFGSRIRYRMGAGYSTHYLKINGMEGPREVSLSAGIAFPIINSWNNRSILNVSVQWTNQTAKHLITENTFRLNIGLTFNERWFAKWKFE